MARPRDVRIEERIRTAAIQLIAGEGSGGCKARRIAQKAGIAVGTIYNYFPGKEQLLARVLDREVEGVIGFHRDIECSSLGPVQKMEAIVRDHLEQVLKRRDLIRALFSEGKPLGALSGFRRYFDSTRAVFEKALREGVETGQFRRCNASVLSSMLAGALAFASMRVLDGVGPVPSELMASVRQSFRQLASEWLMSPSPGLQGGAAPQGLDSASIEEGAR